MNNMFTKKEAPIQGIGGLGGGAFSRLLTSAASGGATEVASRSLRFNDDDQASLSRTPSSAGNRKTFTYSCWFKRANITRGYLFSVWNSDTDSEVFAVNFSSSDTLNIDLISKTLRITDRVFRDPSAWYHLVLSVDTTQSTASDRLKIYINGSQVTSFSTNNNFSQNDDTGVNGTFAHQIGRYFRNSTTEHPFDGYMADIYLIDGSQLLPTSFGAFDDNGVWQAALYSGSYGTNGFHLSFSDATSTTTIAKDVSGKNNNFTANNISVSAGSGNDSLFDVPTNGSQSDTGAGGEVSGNYATWSPLVAQSSGSITLSNGNLDTTCGSTRTTAMSSFLLTGKTYWEVTFGSGTYNYIGMTEATGFNTVANDNSGIKYTGYKDYSYGWQQTDGKLYNASNILATPGTFSNGDVLGWAYDADNNTLKLYKNGTLEHTETGIADAQYFPAITHSGTATASTNFGQRAFAYAAPSGYKALCTTLLSTPDIADGSTAFDVDIYTGTGSTHERSEFSFSPDLVWIKQRNITRNNLIFDTIRGANKFAVTNSSGIPGTGTGMVTSFDSDGFTLGNSDDVNQSSGTFCAWCWDGGTSTVSNTNGNFTTNVRANTSAGFSIVQAPSMTVGTKTLGHGLGATPDMIWIKRASGGTEDWYVFHSAMGTGKQMRLNQTDDEESTTSFGTVNSSVFSYDPNTGDHIAFCFKAITGYSAFGKYTGNGSSDGTFVHTGFRPAFVLQKRSDTSGHEWTIHDSTREPVNDVGLYLEPSTNNAEQDGNRRDFLSNGFKLRTSSAGVNASGGTYIWAAFAENPFQANGGLAY